MGSRQAGDVELWNWMGTVRCGIRNPGALDEIQTFHFPNDFCFQNSLASYDFNGPLVKFLRINLPQS